MLMLSIIWFQIDSHINATSSCSFICGVFKKIAMKIKMIHIVVALQKQKFEFTSKFNNIKLIRVFLCTLTGLSVANWLSQQFVWQ